MQNSKNSKIDFRVHLEQRRILYSVRIDSRPLYFREYREKGRKGSLKPSIAAGLVEMADVKPGQKIVDNFAGAGTILCEAQLQGLEVYGGDIDRDAVKCSRENLSNISEEASNQIKRLDGRDSPHPDNCFDARQASEIIGEKGYRMRTLQTLDSVAAENSTIVTFPTELVGGMSSGENEEGLQKVLDKIDKIGRPVKNPVIHIKTEDEKEVEGIVREFIE
ncbi:putative RNA methylase [Candidatus Haloredivivus sp. G17]|nr:putative RNA methylase [Candidatus Haloredivivus sp. G17]